MKIRKMMLIMLTAVCTAIATSAMSVAVAAYDGDELVQPFDDSSMSMPTATPTTGGNTGSDPQHDCELEGHVREYVSVDERTHCWKCKYCSDEGTRGDHEWEEEIIEATCTKEGKKTSTCSICGWSKSETIEKKDHESDGGKVTKEATCTEEGEKTFTCIDCNEVIKTETIEKKEHESDGGKVTKEATCTEDGEKTFTCTDCNAVIDTEVIEATGHKFSANWSKDKDYHWHECENNGCDEEDSDSKDKHTWENGVCKYCGYGCEHDWEDGVCEDCGYKCEHTWDEGNKTPATCTKKGKIKYTCTVCGKTKIEDIDATGHDLESSATPTVYCEKSTTYVVKSYCTHDGCDFELDQEVVIPAQGHDWGNKNADGSAICSRCGLEAILDEYNNIITQIAEGEDLGREEAITIELPTIDIEPEVDPDPEQPEEDESFEEHDEPIAKDPEQPKKDATSRPSSNPNSGITLSVIPLAVAAALVICKKRG